jgi:hypothetical protein
MARGVTSNGIIVLALAFSRVEPARAGTADEDPADEAAHRQDWRAAIAALEGQLAPTRGDAAAELALTVRLADAITRHDPVPERARDLWLRAARLAEDRHDTAALATVDAGLAGWAVVTAQAADLVPLYRGSIDAWPVREDLVDDGGGLLVGPDGLLWLRRQGLARFDGTFVERVRLEGDPFVRTAFFAEDGELVAGVPGAVWRLDGHARVRTAIDGANGVVGPDGAGGWWIGIGDEVAHRVGDVLVERRPLPALPAASNEALWVAADASGLDVVSRAGLERVTPTRTAFLDGGSDLPDDVRQVVTLGDARLAIGTYGATRLERDETGATFSPVDLTGNPSVRSAAVGPDGAVWMGLGHGIARLDQGVAHVFRERSDRFEQVFGIADWRGAAWFVNEQGEIGRIGSPAFHTLDRRVLPSGWIYAAAARGDGLLVATGSGVVQVGPGPWPAVEVYADDAHCQGIVVDVAAGPPGRYALVSDEVRCAAVVDGDSAIAWHAGNGLPDGVTPTRAAFLDGRACFATSDGVRCQQGADLVVPADLSRFSGQRVDAIASVPDGDVIATHASGLWRVTGGDAVAVDVAGLPPPYELAWTGQELIVGSPGGVRRLDGDRLVIQPGIPASAKAFRAIRLHDGRLLVAATELGVLLSDGDDWVALGVDDGLPSNEIYALHEDPDGALWLGTGGSGLAYRAAGHDDPPPETLIIARGRARLTDPRGTPLSLDAVSLRAPGASAANVGYPPAGTTWLESAAGVFAIPAALSRPLGVGGPLLGGLPRDDAADPEAWPGPVTVDLAGITPERAWSREEHLYRWRVDGGAWHGLRNDTRLALDLADGEHRLEVVAKGRWLAADPTPAVYSFAVDAPTSPWLWPALVGGVAAGGAWQRRRLNDAWLRAKTLRYRPIPPDLFAPRGPLADPEDLVGRRELLAGIAERARRAGRQGASVLVWGEPQSGVTSVLRSIRGAGADRAVVVDLAAVAGPSVDAALALIEAAVRDGLQRDGRALDLVDEGQARTPSLLVSGPDGRPSPYRPFERLVLSAVRSLGGGTLILALDGGDRLLALTEDDETFGPYLLPFVKHLVASIPGLMLVIGVQSDRAELVRRGAELVAISALLTVEPLDADAIGALLARRSARALVFAPEAADRVASRSGGHPAVIEAIGRAVAARLAAARRNLVLAGDVDAPALGELPVFPAMWARLAGPERLLMALVADLPDGCALDRAVELAREKQAPVLDEELRRASADLVRDRRLVVDRDGRLRFAGELFRAWVAREHPIAVLVERARDVIGSYQVLATIGEGGMGVVYKARDLLSGRVCAVKLMARHLSGNADARRRFLREANLLVRLRHPNIVRILARGEHDGHLYMALELIEGESLRKLVRREGRLTWREAVRVVRDVADALIEVHGHGIVHRDIKSDNVIVGADGVPKLTDFGIAYGAEFTVLTQTGNLIGTYAYMSPEQVTGGEARPSWDLYALGVVLYELLTGEMPFTGFGTMALLRAIAFKPADPPSRLAPLVPTELDEIVVRMLQKTPEERYADARAVRDALGAVLDVG